MDNPTGPARRAEADDSPTMTDRLPLKERKRQQTKLRIVEAAVALFTKYGFEATTTDEIAEVAGCSRSTLFRYFGTKEDILFGDVDSRLAALRATLATRHPCDDPWTVAKVVGIEEFIGFLSGESAVSRAAINLWFSHPAPLSRYLELSHQWEQVLAEFFTVERGMSTEVDLASQLHASVLVGTVRAAMRAYSRPDTDLHAAIREAFDLLESGIQLRPGSA
ncbi:MAG: hypothetical protein QOF99_8877 [Pseudonocardiales bacterium]|nr:hypothetical protein [Pseudonocardiales bacterium]